MAPDESERREFTTAVALALEPMAFAPKELLIRIGEFTERMYIIQRGLVARMGRVLGAGRFVGEDVILHNSRRKYFVRVLTYLDVYALSKEALEEILDVSAAAAAAAAAVHPVCLCAVRRNLGAMPQ